MTNKKLNVAVLMGGPSAEHEVSLATGRVILNALDKTKYNAIPVTITKEGRWLLPPAGPEQTAPEAGKAIDKLKSEGVETIFLFWKQTPSPA